ncbi:MAG: 3-deoxy-7-phosphoheptulonate synthase [Spirochaetales bacterium]|nr:3-deoxy-7-phosphoheptulonate synthase [Spirochaetales bacterium]MCF7937370.1 3-deoxy-7-phosphoheptulonate synthase [Spirochaetales bacterium]
MIIVLRKDATEDQKQSITSFLTDKGFKVREIQGEEDTVLGAVGMLGLDIREVEILPGVSRVIPISKPYKLASRELKREDTIVRIGNVRIGGDRFAVLAGPCAVESREQIIETAKIVKEAGAVLLRGGAFKPRTSPYAFQGLGFEGLQYLREAGDLTGMPIVTEVVATEHASRIAEYIDMFQIGARNMQNFELLKTVGRIGKPVLLKRGLSATVEEWLMAAEYLMAHGAEDIVLCERGIRTFETYTRNTLDLSAIPVVKKLSHLPVVVDPSHATGIRAKVPPMALAAAAAGADGLIVEVHPRPDQARSDGPQSLYPEQFEKLMRDLEALSPVLDREIERLPERKKARILLAQEGASSPGTEEHPADIPAVAFQGESGAYSETALKRFYAEEARPFPKNTFRDVFEAVLTGEADAGVLPVENSLSGSIHENYDLLIRYPDISIIGEQKIRIQHNLIGIEGCTTDSIRKVYSHPQGFAQCREYLEAHADWELIPYYDTAGAVAYVAREGSRELAAIAGDQAAHAYGLEILKRGIETNPRNYTRFFVIARSERARPDHPNTASLVFSTLDKPGSLFSCLEVFEEHRLNMKKLESRPIAGRPWEYLFYVDIEFKEAQKEFDDALDQLKDRTDRLRVLGRYCI